jgi:hypothetical protein
MNQISGSCFYPFVSDTGHGFAAAACDVSDTLLKSSLQQSTASTTVEFAGAFTRQNAENCRILRCFSVDLNYKFK